MCILEMATGVKIKDTNIIFVLNWNTKEFFVTVRDRTGAPFEALESEFLLLNTEQLPTQHASTESFYTDGSPNS